MSFSYLTTENIFDRYTDAKQYTESLTDSFPEYERIARNRPHPNIDPAFPKTTDGTTASIIRKTPRRVIQQLPTGVIKSEPGSEWLDIIAGFIYQHDILPHANEEYDLIQKGWTVVEKGLTFGNSPTYTPFLNHEGYFCPDLIVPYWGDVFLQRGKKSGYACKYIFMRSWWQKEDLQAIIEGQSKLDKTIEKTWDVKALQSIVDAVTTKDDKAKTPNERDNEKNVASGIELVTGFQIGVGAQFFTFNPSSKTIVRTKVNKDPRGKMPIDWFYGDIDGSNPLGRGIVELVGPLQNLIDADMQMYQFNRALMLAPPLKKRGNFNKNKIRFIPNQIIDMGTDANADVIPLTIDTTAVANYPALYGLQKSQLLNLTNSPDTSISADVGNPGFSKTPAGIQQQAAVISVDDNYVRKMYETWFQNWSETAINIYFGERTGTEVITLDSDTADKLRKLAEEGKFDPALLNDQDQIQINFDTATPALKFEVDASTTKMADDQKQQQGLTGLLTALDQSPMLAQVVPPENVLAVWNSMVAASGVENPEDLKVDVKEFQQKQEQAQQMAIQQAQAQTAQAQASQVQAQAQMQQQPQPQQQQQMTPEDQQLAQVLQEQGATPDQINRAIAMLNAGYSEDQILQMLQGQQQ